MGFALSSMQLTSPAFADGEPIPARFTGESDDVSPAFAWEKVPEGTRSFALVCHDPDAPLIKPASYGFVHWVLYNIPADVTGIGEASSEYTSGLNDFGNAAYGGPMPPEGHGTHRYFFWLFALSGDEAIEPGLTLWQLLERIEPDVIGMNRLMGTYVRPGQG